jgi:hypothetical protein
MVAAIAQSIGKVAFPLSSSFSVGKRMRMVNAKFTVPTTGNIGDQYVLAGPLSIDDRIARIYSQAMAALTSATTWNLGFYYSKDQLATAAGLVPVKSGGGNELWSGVSLVTAVTTFLDVLTNKNGSLDNTKAIRDLLSLGPDAEPVGGIYLVLTNTTTANTAGGTLDMDVLIDEATTR